MIDPIRELKIRAALLHDELRRKNPRAVARLRTLSEFRSRAPKELEQSGADVRRRHCLALVSIELGFDGWQHAHAVLSGTGAVTDFGTLLYPKRCGGHLNHWYRSYDDALAGHRAAGGYLLAYRRDFFVADRPFIETLGLDPDASEWRRLSFDWVRGKDPAARRSLYGALVAQTPREVSP